MKQTLNRWKDWPTTLVGILFMALALMIGFKDWENHDSWNFIIKVGALAALGWVFLNAKRSLIEGLFMNLFKVKPKKDESGSDA